MDICSRALVHLEDDILANHHNLAVSFGYLISLMATQKRRSTTQDSTQQSTIQHHFNNPEQDTPPPENKRRKLGGHRSTSGDSLRASSDNMYNFGSSKSNPVDLTESNVKSPKARRVSNVGTLSMSNGPNGQSIGTKKLVVKNLKPISKTKPNEYITNTLQQLDTALTAIFQNAQPIQSNEELYKGAENVCKLGSAPDLARLLDRRCKSHISGVVKPVLAQKADDKNVDVLRAVVEAWKIWHRQTVILSP